MPETPEPSAVPGESRPIVVMLGDFRHEGLRAKIENHGFEVVNRGLRSSPTNWQRITALLQSLNADRRLALVFAYIPTTLLLDIAHWDYDAVRPALLAEIERTRGVFFIYEDNLQGCIEPFPWEVDDLEDNVPEGMDSPWSKVVSASSQYGKKEWLEKHSEWIKRSLDLLKHLSSRNIEIVPFRKRSDVTLRIFECLEEAQAGVFLRLYIPHGRYQSEQFEDFLTLFSRYLREVENKEFSVDVHRTARGTTYVFKGRGEAGCVEDLRNAIARFDTFLSISETDPDSASHALEKIGLEPGGAAFIVAKYARSMRRIHLDVRHEFERRRLLLSQSLESELLDASQAELIPLPMPDRASSILTIVGNTAPVTISLSKTEIGPATQLHIERLVSGGIHYTDEDKNILSLIETLSDDVEALKLRSELDRLKDSATPPDERLTAVQKLKSFLYGSTCYIGKKLDEVGTKVLVAYLEKMITGK